MSSSTWHSHFITPAYQWGHVTHRPQYLKEGIPLKCSPGVQFLWSTIIHKEEMYPPGPLRLSMRNVRTELLVGRYAKRRRAIPF